MIIMKINEFANLCYLVLITALALPLSAIEEANTVTLPEKTPIGSSEAEVSIILGDPESTLQLGDRKIVNYRLAEGIFEEGRLVEISFTTEEARTREQAEKQALHDQAIARKEKIIANNLAKATEVRDKQLLNPDFLKATPEYRLRYWKKLQSWCPQLDITNQIRETATELKEFRRLELAAQVKALELKVALLEKSADTAEKKANNAEKRAEKAEDRLDRAKRAIAQFPVVNPVVYPQSTGIFVGPYGRTAITFDAFTGTWRPFLPSNRIIIKR